MASRHDKTVADYIRNQTTETAYHGGLPEGADDAIVGCRMNGGPQGRGRLDGGDQYIREPRVRIIVRGERNNAEAARDRANDLLSTLDGATPSGYLDLRVVNSSPTELKPDDDGRPILTFNVRLLIDEA
jgi:hypothetical protein